MSTGLDVLRRSLWPFSPLYGFVASIRNRMFDGGGFESIGLPVPVISVGNLTVGGTGKTPMVAWLVESLQKQGLRVAVLARGYGRAEGAEFNDEGTMLARRFPSLLQVQNPDRVAGGRALVADGAEVIVLDDGFQHRRLQRDLDILCMDARRPFGRGGMLPSGDLREPVRPGLRRAGMVVLTRSDGLAPGARAERVEQLRGLLPDGVPVHLSVHAPSAIVPLGEFVDGVASWPALDPDLRSWRGRRVVAAAAIARPEAFFETLSGLGCELVRTAGFTDHHRFTAADLARLLAMVEEVGSDCCLVVTEKDAVKLAPRMADLPAASAEAVAGRIGVLRIDLRFEGAEPVVDPSRFQPSTAPDPEV